MMAGPPARRPGTLCPPSPPRHERWRRGRPPRSVAVAAGRSARRRRRRGQPPAEWPRGVAHLLRRRWPPTMAGEPARKRGTWSPRRPPHRGQRRPGRPPRSVALAAVRSARRRRRHGQPPAGWSQVAARPLPQRWPPTMVGALRRRLGTWFPPLPLQHCPRRQRRQRGAPPRLPLVPSQPRRRLAVDPWWVAWVRRPGGTGMARTGLAAQRDLPPRHHNGGTMGVLLLVRQMWSPGRW